MFVWLPIRDGALAAVLCFTQTGDVTSKESTYLSWNSSKFSSVRWFLKVYHRCHPCESPDRDADTSQTLLYGLCGCGQWSEDHTERRLRQVRVLGAIQYSDRAGGSDRCSVDNTPPGQSAEEHTDSRPFPWWCVDVKAFKRRPWGPSAAGLVLPSRWIYLFLLSLVLFPVWLLPFGFFNGWAGIISHSACTAQDVVFGELRWCSALFLNGCDLGRVPQQCSLMYGPRGRICAPLSHREAERAPPSYSEFTLNWWCVCEREFLFFLARWKCPEWSCADLCGFADVVFIVNY